MAFGAEACAGLFAAHIAVDATGGASTEPVFFAVNHVAHRYRLHAASRCINGIERPARTAGMQAAKLYVLNRKRLKTKRAGNFWIQ
jgi:hypothetical protein